MNLVPMENPPEVLTAKARDIVRSLGYTDRAADRTSSFFAEYGLHRVHAIEGSQHGGVGACPRATSLRHRLLVPAVPDAARRGTVLLEWRSRRWRPSRNGSRHAYGRHGYGRQPAPFCRSSTRARSTSCPAHCAPGLGSALLGRPPGPGEVHTRRTGMVAVGGHGHSSGVDRILSGSIRSPGPHRSRIVSQQAGLLSGDLALDAPKPVYTGSSHGSQALRSVANYAIGAIVLIAALWIAHYNWKAGRGDLRGATARGHLLRRA